LAVASELKRLQPDIRIVYIGQKGDKLADIPAQHPAIDEVRMVRAGKFRRYHGVGWKQFFFISTQAKNLRDAIYVLIGLWQSFWLMRQLKPQVTFTRGGFVSVPVAFGGYLNHVPYITHDSDSLPSLANRIIARKAVLHAVAQPAETYPYPLKRTITVGIPLSDSYQLITPDMQQNYRRELGFEAYKRLLFITGGGNGAKKLNNLIVANVPVLLERYPDLIIVHVAGRAMEQAINQTYDQVVVDPAQRQRIRVESFIHDLYRYNGAADVVITRGGATTLAELAVQGKACIVVPAKQLVWNVRNVEALAAQQAIIPFDEDHSTQEQSLAAIVTELMDDERKRSHLADNFHKLAHPDAAKRLAEILLDIANKQTNSHELKKT